MQAEIIQQLTGITVVLALSYAAGWLLWAPFGPAGRDDALSCFGKLALGAVSLTTGFAVFHTGGRTVCLGFVLIYLGALAKINKGYSRTKKTQIEWKELLLVFMAAFAYLVIQWLTNQYFNPAVASLGDEDYGIYAATAEYLKQAGVERPSPWYELSGIASTRLAEPYHYPDLWLAAITQSARLSTLSAYNYVYLPVVCSICFAANRAVITRYSGGRLTGFFIPFLAIYFPAMFWGWPFSGGYNYPIWIWAKTAPAYWLLAGALMLIRDKKGRIPALAVLSGLPVLNAVYAPVTGIFFLVIAGWSLFREGRKWTQILADLLIPVFAAGFLTGFYAFYGEWVVGSESARIPLDAYAWRAIRGWSAAVVKHLVFVWPLFLLAAALFYRDRTRMKAEGKFLGTWLILVLSGVFCKGIFNANGEVEQFFLLTANPLAAISFVFLTGLSFEVSGKRRDLSTYTFGILFVLIWSFVQVAFIRPQHPVVNGNFLKDAIAGLNGKNPIGAALADPEQENFYTADPRMCLFGSFLGLTGKGYWVNALSVPENEEQFRFPERTGAIRRSPFFRFIRDQKRKGDFVDYSHAQMDFIQQQAIDFVVVEKGAEIPLPIQHCAQKTLTDPLTGVRLLILGRPCAY